MTLIAGMIELLLSEYQGPLLSLVSAHKQEQE